MNTEILELIEYLKGSCNDIVPAALLFGLDYYTFTKEQEEYIDSEIFMCDQCSWWCGTDEYSSVEENMCQECAPDNE